MAEKGHTLIELQRLDEAEILFRDLTQNHPMLPEGYSGLAMAAQSRRDWELALERWESCIARFPYPVRFEWHHNKSLMLLWLEHYDRAESSFRNLITINAGSPAGYIGLAQLADRLNNTELALKRWEACINLFPDPFRPEWTATHAALLVDLGRVEEAEYLLSILTELAPNDSGVLIGSARLATRLRNSDQARSLWERVFQLFRDDSRIMLRYLKSLIKFGEHQRAIALCREELEKHEDKQFRMLLCELYIDHQDLLSAKQEVSTLLSLYPDDINSRLKEINLLIKNNTPADTQKALDKYEELVESYPESLRAKLGLIESYIRVERPADAMRLLEEIPEKYHSLLRVANLRSWYFLRKGEIDTAKQISISNQKKIYKPALDAPFSLTRMDKRPITPNKDEVFLFCHAKDNVLLLPWLLDYYRELGVNRFFIVDNDSSDDTSEFLLSQPDVHVFWSPDNYAKVCSGMRWVNELVERYGDGHWCIFVDTDEALVFPGIEEFGLQHLLRYMDKKNQELMQAFMLDMYPRTRAELSTFRSGDDLISHSPYFDTNYYFRGSPRCPFRTAHGGVRHRLFGRHEVLCKIPIIKGGRGIKYLEAHGTTVAEISDVTGALLHFALTQKEIFTNPSWELEQDENINTRLGQCIKRYSHYNEVLAELEDNYSFICEFSEKYKNSDQLVDLGLINRPADFFPQS